MFLEGQKLGEYALLKQLGKGGFGEVWLGETDGKYFALKFPHKDQVDWKSITQEIGVWVLCGKHPNVMSLIGARNFNGQIAIISEYAPDGSLSDLLKQKGKLSVEEAVKMTDGILKGLHHLHESGIIHRDLKPANILLDGKLPRLTDFGISRVSKQTDSLSMTISGTLKYMAPECFDGKRNVQTDVWAVGVILYQMITGLFPYSEEETVQFIAAVVLKEPQTLPDSVPLSLRNIISSALTRDVAKRFQTAEQMRQSLSTISVEDLSIKDIEIRAENIPPQRLPEVPVQQSNPTVGIKQETIVSQKPKKPVTLLMIVVGVFSIILLLFGLGGTGIYYLVKNANLKETPTPTPRISPSPIVSETTFKEEFYDSDGKIEEVLNQIEQQAGGKLKIVRLGIYSNTRHYLNMVIQDPNNPENFDQYIYQNGTIEKKPEKSSSSRTYTTFSVADINWKAIPNLVKIAKEKTKDLEGMDKPYVNVDYKFGSTKNLAIDVSISGKRKDFRLSANANGDVEKIEIK